MSLDRLAEQFAYGLGNATGIVSQISPVNGITITSLKTGARIGKSIASFGKGGWINPCFYLNSASAGCSGASLALQCIAHCSSVACPAVALPIYGASQLCGATADVLDSSCSLATLF